MKRRILAGVLAAVMTFTTIPVNALAANAPKAAIEQDASNLPQSDGNTLRMWYTTPGTAGTWENTGLVIGNGTTGGILFGQVGKDQIHFNEKTLWQGGPSESRPNYDGGNRDTATTAEQLKAFRQKADDHSTDVFPHGTGGLGNFMGDGNGMGHYQDFGDLYLDFAETGMTNDNVSNYVRDLDMRTAVSSLNYDYKGVHYEREYFASHPDGVLVTHLSASKNGKLSFTASVRSDGGLTTNAKAENGRITLAGQVKDNQMKCEMQAQILNKGGELVTNDNGTVTVTGADEVTIVLATGTNYKNEYPTYRGEDPHAGVTAEVDAAVAKSYEELKAAHVADYQELFNRVDIDLGGTCPELPTDQMMKNYRAGDYDLAVEEMVYQFGRYLTIAGSREGDPLPTNLAGIWCIGGPAWGGDFHFNVNVQMNYWPALATNLAECETVFNDYIESIVEPGRVTAGQSCNLPTETGTKIGEGNGFLVHTQNNPFGCTASFGSQEYGWNIGGSSWALQNVYDYYLYTGDTEYLRTKIYPMLKEMANFWDQFLWYSEYQDRLVVGPSTSAEQGPTVNGTTYDQSIVWELYKMAIEASEILDVDAEKREVWKEKQSQLNPIIIGEQGQVKEWFEETTLGRAQAGDLEEVGIPNFGAGGGANQGSVHRHTSQLIGLYPGTLINKDTTEWMQAAIKSLEQRSLNGTGWSKAMKINMYARTGLGDDTYKMVRGMCAGNQNGILDNLLDSHPPFQIDGNYGLTAGMTEMLLQSQLGYTQFLPALPKAWANGSISGIKSRGNFTISETWKNGLAEEFTVCYDGKEASSTFTGEYKNITDAKVMLDGQEIEVEKDLEKGQISFEAVKGQTYTIDLSGANLDELTEKAAEFLETMHPDLAKAKEELQAAITTESTELGALLQKAQLMDQLYRSYVNNAEKIYYMTTEEGLTNAEIDTMYNEMRALRSALLENTEDMAYYRNAEGSFKKITATLNSQMSNKVVAFSKESGAVAAGETLTLSKSADAEKYDIRYTLDGSEPRKDSALYEGAIDLNAEGTTTVRAALFLREQRVSPVYTKVYAGKITISGVTANTGNWGSQYYPEKMIDGNSGSRWASKDPYNGDIEIVLTLPEATAVNTVRWDQFVSGHNYIRDFEIQALQDGEYVTVYNGTATNAGTGGDHSVEIFTFDTVTTDSVKLVLKEGYSDTSMYEVEVMGLEAAETPAGNPESLNAMIALAEAADRSSQDYANAPQSLKDAFEESITDAEEAAAMTQSAMDSREEFLRSRYNRLGFGVTDKTVLESLIAEAEEAVNGAYTRDSIYRLRKALEAAKAVFDDTEARQPAVDAAADALKGAFNNLVTLDSVTVTVPIGDLEGGAWITAGAFRATNKDSAGKLTYKFAGNGIKVPTVKAADHGTIRVIIANEDGTEVYNEDIDTYAADRVEGVLLMETKFANGTYTISFEHVGGNWVEVGALTITKPFKEEVDRTALEEELAACEALNAEDYTEASWEAFAAVLAEAEAVYAKAEEDTCTAEMEDYAAQLAKMREALVEKPTADLTELEKALGEARVIAAEGYTEESYQALQQAIAEVEAFLNGTYTQEDVDAKTVMLRTAISKLEALYTINVENGTIAGTDLTSGNYIYNTSVTVAANTPAADEKFVGWQVNEVVVSKQPTYSFYVSGSMTLKAVYASADVEVEEKAEALMTSVIMTKRPDGKSDVKFVGQLVVPEGYKIQDAGLVWSSKDGTELKLGAAGAKATHITKISNTNQFSVTIKGMPAGKFVRGTIFATVVKDETTDTVYSAEKKAEAK